jgi:hypothetical protein|tara:strand:- start:655 stop:843 length:189 start_codon:yes stop_codon:yes gene_type:complete
MTKEEILKELESISYQLDSTSNGFVENESDLGGAKNDLNYIIDTLDNEVIWGIDLNTQLAEA